MNRFCYPSPLVVAVMGVMLFGARAALAQPLDCDINYQPVNPSNGNTTAGKTGLMRCFEKDTDKLRYEQEYNKGKAQGLTRHYKEGKVASEVYRDPKGHPYLSRRFHPNGQLEREEKELSNDGKTSVETTHTYYEDGQLQRVNYQENNSEKAVIEFLADGRLADLRCGAKSLVEEDAKPCGFSGGPSEVSFFSARYGLVGTASYDDGRLLWQKRMDGEGRVNYSETTEDRQRVARWYFESGAPQAEVVFSPEDSATMLRPLGRIRYWLAETVSTEREWGENNQLIKEIKRSQGYTDSQSEWYLNGQPKLVARYRYADKGTRSESAVAEIESYSDLGKLVSVERRTDDKLVGKQEYFDEAGRKQSEEIYDEKGRRIASKTFDAAGNVIKEEAFHADGSRKL